MLDVFKECRCLVLLVVIVVIVGVGGGSGRVSLRSTAGPAPLVPGGAGRPAHGPGGSYPSGRGGRGRKKKGTSVGEQW